MVNIFLKLNIHFLDVNHKTELVGIYIHPNLTWKLLAGIFFRFLPAHFGWNLNVPQLQYTV